MSIEVHFVLIEPLSYFRIFGRYGLFWISVQQPKLPLFRSYLWTTANFGIFRHTMKLCFYLIYVDILLLLIHFEQKLEANQNKNNCVKSNFFSPTCFARRKVRENFKLSKTICSYFDLPLGIPLIRRKHFQMIVYSFWNSRSSKNLFSLRSNKTISEHLFNN